MLTSNVSSRLNRWKTWSFRGGSIRARILWIQQFGRGLRLAEGKERLTVVDYIGNHRVFLLKPQTLLNLGGSDREIALALERLERGELELPPGCDVTYELEAVNILRALLRVPKGPEALKVWYESFKERHGTRPTALEAHHSGYAHGLSGSHTSPGLASFESWETCPASSGQHFGQSRPGIFCGSSK